MLKKDTKLQQEELIDKYLNDEINIIQFIQKHNEKKYIDFEYPLSFNQKIMDKIKKDIKKYSDKDIQLTLKITNVEKSKYNKYEYEEFKIIIIKNFKHEEVYY